MATSIMKNIQKPQDVFRYQNFHTVEEGGKLHNLFVHDVCSMSKDQFIRDIWSF